MSPNPGEPEHNEHGWTHAICDECFNRLKLRRGWVAHPTRALNEHGDYQIEPCCWCGSPTMGIYVRANAREVHGSGVTT